MCDRQHPARNLRRFSVVVFATICAGVFLCARQTDAQVTVGGVITVADLTQPVPGDCANYNSVLSSTGVSANGQTHPGRCRSSVLTLLFDGAQLGSNMLGFLNSNAHPPLFAAQLTGGRGRNCATASKLKVTLSASLQATRLEWTGAPVIGLKCTDEGARVNAVSLPTSAASSAYMRRLMSLLLESGARELMSSPQLRGCGRTQAAARLALDQQVWNLLQRVASDEAAHFETSVAPAIDVSGSCGAKCNLCFPGWVGSIQCSATVNDPSYQWTESQNWDVGGTPLTGTAGSTIYPASFTATGNGSKLNGPSWTIDAAQMGTLTDAGVNTSKRFSTSNATVAGGLIWSGNVPPAAEGEMQLKFNADQVGGNTATNDPMPTLPSCINTPQRPPSIACNVSCTWNLLNQ